MAAFAPNGQPFALLSFSKCRYASDARGARSAVAAQTGPERSNGEVERSGFACKRRVPLPLMLARDTSTLSSNQRLQTPPAIA